MFHKISVVQARPLNRPNIVPSPKFHRNITKIRTENLVEATTVVSAGATVIKISRRDQIIAAPTLNEALYSVSIQTSDKKTIAAIVVQEDAEPNSHEATVLASDGKLVMIAHNYEKFTMWLNSPIFNIYLDPQQEISSMQELKNEESINIKDGYITHPTPLKYPFPPILWRVPLNTK